MLNCLALLVWSFQVPCAKCCLQKCILHLVIHSYIRVPDEGLFCWYYLHRICSFTCLKPCSQHLDWTEPEFWTHAFLWERLRRTNSCSRTAVWTVSLDGLVPEFGSVQFMCCEQAFMNDYILSHFISAVFADCVRWLQWRMLECAKNAGRPFPVSCLRGFEVAQSPKFLRISPNSITGVPRFVVDLLYSLLYNKSATTPQQQVRNKSNAYKKIYNKSTTFPHAHEVVYQISDKYTSILNAQQLEVMEFVPYWAENCHSKQILFLTQWTRHCILRV